MEQLPVSERLAVLEVGGEGLKAVGAVGKFRHGEAMPGTEGEGGV